MPALSLRLVFSVAIALIASPAVIPAPAQAVGPNNAVVVDARRDPRLARKLVLRAEAVPVVHVLRRLTEQTGVTLTARGPAGDERLIAFTHESTLAEIMRAIADLYRLQWTRGTGEKPAYVLSKRPAEAAEERELKRAAFRRLLERVHGAIAAAQNPEVPATIREPHRESWRRSMGLRAAAFRQVAARWDELLQESYLEVPIPSLPEAERKRVMELLVPFLEQQHADRLRSREQLLAFHRQRGEEPPKDLLEVPKLMGPDDYAFRIAFNLARGGELWMALWGGNMGSILSEGQAEALPELGMELYADRAVRPAPERMADRVEGALGKPLSLPASAVIPVQEKVSRTAPNTTVWTLRIPADRKPGEEAPKDWISRLSLLADATGLAFFSDAYDERQVPRDGIPLWAAGKGTVAEALDALCRGAAWNGGVSLYSPLPTNSFWWARDRTVFLRSRRWLWAEYMVVPAALVDRLSLALREKRNLTALELPLLAGLPAVRGTGQSVVPGPLTAWKYGLQLPLQLSAASRALLTGPGLSLENMPAADRIRLLPTLPRGTEGRDPTYAASVTLRPVTRLGSGVVGAEVRVQVTLNGQESASLYTVPLPASGGFDLLVAPARPASSPDLPRLVCALYYPWFGLPEVSGKLHKQDRIDLRQRKVGSFAHYPQTGPYDSTDEAVLRRHLAQAKGAGIDVLVCSWWGPDDLTDRALRKLMALARGEELRVCLLLEPWATPGSPEKTATQLAEWLKEFQREEAYLKVEGNPVVFLQNDMKGKLPPQGWAEVLARLERNGPLFLVGGRTHRVEASVFAGLHSNLGLPRGLRDNPAAVRNWMDQQLQATSGWGRGRPPAVVATVIPGFDMRHLSQTDYAVYRNRGRVYRDSWEAALKARPDWVLINSFNHWQAGTEIEPSDQFGDTYLRLTAEYVARFKAAPPAENPAGNGLTK